ncbi:DUF732 domain-containing protein [Mycobacterium paragordonae]|nr:DUF732 domain-containing protein [Mycobacterium paragordonae]TDL04114.1 DUF732 domain-containing protein [Mycobacterium paragordonae]
MSLLIGAVLLPFAAVLASPPAAADGTDDAFIAALQRHGITVANPNTAIATAHSVCSDLDAGRSRTSLVLPLAKAANLTAHEAGFFVGVTVASFCPQYADDAG